MHHSYWFRPKRFWKYWAFFVPANRWGWIATGILLVLAIGLFIMIDRSSHSVSDTVFGFAPWAILFLALYDLLCFRLGEYPKWWQQTPHTFSRQNRTAQTRSHERRMLLRSG